MLLLAAARPDVVDRTRRDRQHRHGGEYGEERHQQKHRALRQRPADDARGRGDRDVAAMVPGGVAAHPASQRGTGKESQGQRRDRRAEDVADRCYRRVGDHHRPKGGGGENRHRSGREDRQRCDDEPALPPRRVDQSADRGLNGEPQQAARGRDQPDRLLAPMLLGDQKDVQIGAERAAHVGKQEIQRVERDRVEFSARHRVTPRGAAARCCRATGFLLWYPRTAARETSNGRTAQRDRG